MDSAKVKKVYEDLYGEYVKDLEFLTNIDSVTGNIENSRKIAKWLEEQIKSLGGTSEVRDNGRGAHVIARFKGKGKKKPFLVVHTDTVLGTDNGKWLFKMDANQIASGPGVGDCKASAIQMLYLVRGMKKLGVEPYSELVVFFDAEEEGGSADEIKFAEELAQESDYAVICDTGRPDWGVVTKRKSKSDYIVELTGISGHAGNAPHSTANALAAAADMITKVYALTACDGNPLEFTTEALAKKGIQDLGQYIPANYINIAVLECANNKINVVPDKVVLKMELRCYENAEQERLGKAIMDICSKPVIQGVTSKVTMGGLPKGPMEKDARAAQLFDTYKNIVKREYGANVNEWTAGGLTIGNNTSKFIPTIDALGVDCDPAIEHTTREVIDLKRAPLRTVALFHLLNEMDAK